MQDGHDVVIMAPKDAYTEQLVEMGVTHFDVPMKMNKNPVSDYFLYRRFLKAFSFCAAGCLFGLYDQAKCLRVNGSP